MAFESLVAYVILFTVGLSAVVGLAFYYKDYLVRTSESLDSRQELLGIKENSDIEITQSMFIPPPVYQKVIITDEDDYSEGIFDFTNETMEPGNITLDLNGAVYHEQGNWTSRIYDMGHATNFSRMYWKRVAPGQTWMGVQIRTAVNASELTGQFIGPDGTVDTYYDLSGQPINDIHDNDTVMQLKVYLNTTNTAVTPVLEELNITYSFLYGMFLVEVLNDGKVKLNEELLDVFVDEERLPRDYPQLFNEIIIGTDVKNPGLWDPDEKLRITFPYNLTKGKHTLRMVSEFSSTDYVAVQYN